MEDLTRISLSSHDIRGNPKVLQTITYLVKYSVMNIHENSSFAVGIQYTTILPYTLMKMLTLHLFDDKLSSCNLVTEFPDFFQNL